VSQHDQGGAENQRRQHIGHDHTAQQAHIVLPCSSGSTNVGDGALHKSLVAAVAAEERGETWPGGLPAIRAERTEVQYGSDRRETDSAAGDGRNEFRTWRAVSNPGVNSGASHPRLGISSLTKRYWTEVRGLAST
jgi:hypothetical protein